jgi:hypothetical protein
MKSKEKMARINLHSYYYDFIIAMGGPTYRSRSEVAAHPQLKS